MDADTHVLVIGAASLDIKGRASQELVRGTSIPGQIRVNPGGVARNIAENLARLDVNTVLLSVVGDDDAGTRILGQAAGSGVDISNVLVAEGQQSGRYIAVLNPDGSLASAVDDLSIMARLSPGELEAQRSLFEGASMVAVDANIQPETLAMTVQLCREYGLPLCADPSSALLADRLRPHLSSLHMISPNLLEAQVLSGLTIVPNDPGSALAAAKRLVGLGVGVAIIALGEHGVIYADMETAGHIPAIQTHVTDPTGAGDAMTAAIIFGLLEGIPLDESVRLGVTAASLTLRTPDTVRPDLSVDLLYDELVI